MPSCRQLSPDRSRKRDRVAQQRRVLESYLACLRYRAGVATKRSVTPAANVASCSKRSFCTDRNCYTTRLYICASLMERFATNNLNGHAQIHQRKTFASKNNSIYSGHMIETIRTVIDHWQYFSNLTNTCLPQNSLKGRERFPFAGCACEAAKCLQCFCH